MEGDEKQVDIMRTRTGMNGTFATPGVLTMPKIRSRHGYKSFSESKGKNKKIEVLEEKITLLKKMHSYETSAAKTISGLEDKCSLIVHEKCVHLRYFFTRMYVCSRGRKIVHEPMNG